VLPALPSCFAVGGRPACLPGSSPDSTVGDDLPIQEGMSATIDDRLLERWQTSQRHQDEARRFLARQRISDPRGERRALDEIVGTIADLELTLRDRAARRLPPPCPPGPLSA